MTGPLPSPILWLPVSLAMLLAAASILWLLTHIALPSLDDSKMVDDGASAGASIAVHTQGDRLSPIFTPEVRRWEADILRWAGLYELDPDLVATVMQIESCGHPDVRSSAGAIGLFQVMPYHFSPGEDPFDPDTNAKRGLAYLARGLQLSGGNTELALAGYNGGHGVIQQAHSNWSAETQRYFTWGSGILADIAVGSAESASLQSWLEAGGSNLCRRAAQALAQVPAAETP
ncbi:MAG TPA: lytic transglycosylase domain-containing protein [Anaerolineae bacterium]|nr:lytic transglycosylase domain-containing protein [Anaerolineae bacterium]